jgi:hypothetical protein
MHRMGIAIIATLYAVRRGRCVARACPLRERENSSSSGPTRQSAFAGGIEAPRPGACHTSCCHTGVAYNKTTGESSWLWPAPRGSRQRDIRRALQFFVFGGATWACKWVHGHGSNGMHTRLPARAARARDYNFYTLMTLYTHHRNLSPVLSTNKLSRSPTSEFSLFFSRRRSEAEMAYSSRCGVAFICRLPCCPALRLRRLQPRLQAQPWPTLQMR